MATKTPKSGKITPENQMEARALKAIWESDQGRAVRREAGHFTQEAFGEAYNIGNQAAVGFFLNGHTALSLKAAHGFARGLGCRIADFSPRLAALVEPEAVRPPIVPPRQMAPIGIDHTTLDQLIRDLRAIPARRRSQLLDQIHQEAEFAREAYENLTANPEPPAPKVPSAAARRRHAGSGDGARITLAVRHGDGNPLQGVLPLTTVPDPFSAQPGQREREWYDRIDTSKEHPK